MDLNNYLDVWSIFTNDIVGDVWLFVFIGLAVIIIFSLAKRMPPQVTVLLCGTWMFICSAYAPNLFIMYILLVFGTASYLYYVITTVIR